MQTYTIELNSFVTTLEQSKKLLELGIEFETKFVWYVQTQNGDKSIRRRSQVTQFFDNEIYPAFTSDELWEVYKSIDPTINRTKLIDDLFYYILEHKSTESGITQ